MDFGSCIKHSRNECELQKETTSLFLFESNDDYALQVAGLNDKELAYQRLLTQLQKPIADIRRNTLYPRVKIPIEVKMTHRQSQFLDGKKSESFVSLEVQIPHAYKQWRNVLSKLFDNIEFKTSDIRKKRQLHQGLSSKQILQFGSKQIASHGSRTVAIDSSKRINSNGSRQITSHGTNQITSLGPNLRSSLGQNQNKKEGDQEDDNCLLSTSVVIDEDNEFQRYHATFEVLENTSFTINIRLAFRDWVKNLEITDLDDMNLLQHGYCISQQVANDSSARQSYTATHILSIGREIIDLL